MLILNQLQDDRNSCSLKYHLESGTSNPFSEIRQIMLTAYKQQLSICATPLALSMLYQRNHIQLSFSHSSLTHPLSCQ